MQENFRAEEYVSSIVHRIEGVKNFGAVPDNMKKCYRGTDEKESIKQD